MIFEENHMCFHNQLLFQNSLKSREKVFFISDIRIVFSQNSISYKLLFDDNGIRLIVKK